MNDRELLELAAKAAEYAVVGWNDGTEPYSSGPGLILESGLIWNPRLSGGQALDLACDLGLSIYPIARTTSGAACSAVASVGYGRLSEVADASLDTQTATRLAIVLAAAEIERRK